MSVKRVIQDLLCELAWNAPYRNASDEQLEAYWQKYLDKSDSWRAYDLMSREPTDAELGEISSALLQDDAHPEYHFYFGRQDYRHPRHISVRPGLRAAKEYTNPSISELLYKRIAKALPTSLNKSSTNGDSLALDLAMYSYYWDSKQSLPALRLATNRFLTVLPSLGAEFNSWSYRNFDLVLDARKALGDQSYIHDQQVYADILMARSANQDPGACQYFINRIDDPNVQPLARKLLFDPGSGYQLQHYFSLKPMDLAILGSPIVLLPEGKAMAAKLLDDRSALLEDQIIASYGPNFVRDEGGQYVQVAKSRYDRLRPCDLMARAIWRIKGCPNFDLAWPQNKRDHTLPSIRRFFEQLNATNLDYRYMWATGTVN